MPMDKAMFLSLIWIWMMFGGVMALVAALLMRMRALEKRISALEGKLEGKRPPP